jgi:hypothetical protein
MKLRLTGKLLLGIWLILYGAVALVPKLSFNGVAEVLAVLAIVAGVLLVMDR